MHLDEQESELLKKWIISKLDSVSDADPDVLADYVLALVKTDDTERVVRTNCVENLRDFLQNNTDAFVNQMLEAIRTRSYDQASKQAATLQGRKRSSSFMDLEEDSDTLNRGGRKALKAQRAKQERARKDGSARRLGNIQAQYPAEAQTAFMPTFPSSLPGMPPYDPNNPLATFMAMQYAIESMSGMMLPGSNAIGAHAPRCREFDKTGSCRRGAACRFQHRVEDPPARSSANRDGSNSHKKMVDPKATTLVVKRIPPQNLDEAQVRGVFDKFGDVTGVEMRPNRALAIVTFSTHESARAAYESPAPIFDNRFVQVNWQHADRHRQPRHDVDISRTDQDSTEVTANGNLGFDTEEFRQRQEEAQRRFEETRQAREEISQKRQELDRQIAENKDARAAVLRALSEKTGESFVTADETELLEAQLAKLEAEATALGIDPTHLKTRNPAHDQSVRDGSLRGGMGGRGSYRSFSGNGRSLRGAVARLDNRPKTLVITFEDGEYEKHEEDLRQYFLFGGGESATLSRHPEKPSAALLSFNQRYQAENFISAASRAEIPRLGKVTFSWHTASNEFPEAVTTMNSTLAEELSTEPIGEAVRGDEAQYDVDRDDEQWG